jgi:hypothetical protein
MVRESAAHWNGGIISDALLGIVEMVLWGIPMRNGMHASAREED